MCHLIHVLRTLKYCHMPTLYVREGLLQLTGLPSVDVH